MLSLASFAATPTPHPNCVACAMFGSTVAVGDQFILGKPTSSPSVRRTTLAHPCSSTCPSHCRPRLSRDGANHAQSRVHSMAKCWPCSCPTGFFCLRKQEVVVVLTASSAHCCACSRSLASSCSTTTSLTIPLRHARTRLADAQPKAQERWVEVWNVSILHRNTVGEEGRLSRPCAWTSRAQAMPS